MSIDKSHPTFDDSSAADEPTAMWDASALKEAGLEEAAKRHESKEPDGQLAAPVTAPTVPVEVKPARPKRVPKRSGKSRSKGLSMPMLAFMAVAVGLIVYFGVSILLS